MLSDEQRETIENSLWVVNTALKNQGLSSDEDLRQSAILYMCTCLERYDERKHAKWTTYAYKSVYFYIKRLHNKEIKTSNRQAPLDLAPALKDAEMIDESIIIINKIKGRCEPVERQIIDLKLQGYDSKAIGAIIGCSNNTVIKHFRTVKEKAQAVAEEYAP